jgi:hypothetical protein
MAASTLAGAAHCYHIPTGFNLVCVQFGGYIRYLELRDHIWHERIGALP